MTEQLQQAIDRLQHLPAEAQNAIAERILDDLDEWEWNEIVSKPGQYGQVRSQKGGRKPSSSRSVKPR